MNKEEILKLKELLNKFMQEPDFEEWFDIDEEEHILEAIIMCDSYIDFLGWF